jgi:hypothetical protein
MAIRIDELFVFACTDSHGDEGIIAKRTHDGQWVPLVCADVERVDIHRQAAQDVADRYGLTVRLLRFTTRTELEVLTPAPAAPRAVGGRCRVCGCTDGRACPGGCAWVAPDLCSACIRNQ